MRKTSANMMKWQWRLALSLFSVFLLFFSCGKKKELLKNQSNIVNISFRYTPLTIDPRKETDAITLVLSHMLYEGLYSLQPDGTLIPALSEHVEISKDQKEYTFFLKKSAWSDASPLTAYHFESAWKKLLDPSFNSSVSYLFFPIKNAEEAKIGECSTDEVCVKAIDDQTLFVQLKHPTPYFLELTAYPPFFPVPNNGDEVPYPNNCHTHLSNGPFKLSYWKDEDKIIVAKNDQYWNRDKIKVDEVQISIVSDETTALLLFNQGSLDYIGGFTSPLPVAAIAALEQSHDLYKTPDMGTTFAAFNVNKFPFGNLNIRKAFSKALDKQAIIDNVSQMCDELAYSIVPNSLKKAVFKELQEYSSKDAIYHFELGLKELGINRKEFPLITYSYFTSELQRNLALAVQSQLKKVLDVEVRLDGKDLKTYLAKFYNHEFQIGQMSWVTKYYDPMCFLERFVDKDSSYNCTGWENTEYQQLIKDSFFVEGEERSRLLSTAEQKLADEVPVIPIYHFRSVYLTNPRMHGLAISPTGNMQFDNVCFKSS